MARKTGTKDRASLDHRLAKAMSHPLRARILATLGEQTASSSELEPILKAPLSNISYHVRELEKYGLIEPVKHEHVRGAVKTTYRAVARMHLTQEDWSKLNKPTRSGLSLAAVTETFERASRAIEADTFDTRLDRHVVNLHLDLDEEGWADVSQIILKAQTDIEAAQERATNRTSDPTRRFRATASLLSYESPQDTKRTAA